jgi:hypothetical protein
MNKDIILDLVTITTQALLYKTNAAPWSRDFGPYLVVELLRYQPVAVVAKRCFLELGNEPATVLVLCVSML